MTIEEFTASTQDAAASPPDGLNPCRQALWYAKAGDWEHAHELAQAVESPMGSLVHAYLHRVEGDVSNAGYWYARAGRPAQSGDLDAEWEDIATELLQE